MGTAVIIGGGAGGAYAARAMRKMLRAEHQIILLEKERKLYSRTSLPLLAFSRRKEEDLVRNTVGIKNRGIQVIVDEAVNIVPNMRRIQTKTREIRYDLAVVAIGSGLRTNRIPGLEEAGTNISTIAGAAKLRRNLSCFLGEDIAILLAEQPIIYPPAPYEYALSLENWLTNKNLGKETSISIFSCEPAPISIFGEKVSDLIAELLLKKRIRLHLNCRVKKVSPIDKYIELEEGRFPFDLLLYCPQAFPSPLIKRSGLADKEGWLQVDRHCQVSRQEEIMGIGDVTAPGGKIIPKMGVVAYRQAQVAACNAVQLLKGEKPTRQFNGNVNLLFETGKGVLPFTGILFSGRDPFRRHPGGRLWSPLKTFLNEQRWKRDH